MMYLLQPPTTACIFYNGEEFRYLDSEASDFLKLNTCNASLAVNDSLMVFGSILNGIIFTDQQGNIYNRFNKSNGLNNNSVLSLYKGMDNGLWIGLDQGVNFLDLSTPFVHYANTGGTLGTIYALHRKNNTCILAPTMGFSKQTSTTKPNTINLKRCSSLLTVRAIYGLSASLTTRLSADIMKVLFSLRMMSS
jgi:hypothetical protein